MGNLAKGDFMITIPIFLIVIFVVWNNIPDLVEAIGHFMVAHATAIKHRKTVYRGLRENGKSVLVSTRNT